MSDPILQNRLPLAPWTSPATWRLPGIQPIDPALWMLRDDAFAGQMRLRDRLLSERRDEVHDLLPDALPAARECLRAVLDAIAADPGYTVTGETVTRPDGVTVTLDFDAPLVTAGRLVQADLCIMEQGSDGHILTGAVLCFPSGWLLSQKMGRPLLDIHIPVRDYDEDLNRRVQRLFDAIRPGQVLLRTNANLHKDAELFIPRRENAPRRALPRDEARYVRSERQTLRRLPETGAVIFGIHTSIVPLDRLDDDQRDNIEALFRKAES